jgi:esterase
VKLHFKAFPAKSIGGSKRSSVLILHGLFGMLDNWQIFARHLSEDFPVYAMDLRNHGRSPHTGAFSYSGLVEDIREFITTHDLAPATLLGHSLGGKTAMYAALHFQELVDRLIVVDIAPRVYPAGHEDIIEALQGINPESLTTRSRVEEALMPRIHDRVVVLFLMKNLARRPDGTLYWRMNLKTLAASYPNTLTGIESDTPFLNPVLFVRGGKSGYITDGDWAGIRELFPEAQLRTIADAGHWVHADALDELLQVVREFLKG